MTAVIIPEINDEINYKSLNNHSLCETNIKVTIPYNTMAMNTEKILYFHSWHHDTTKH